ncbi:ABC transporter ATP-binding protein [Demequina sp. NBRC 110054]|uniref:ABC transporter ATP-binding protein n=1 Tax=Demequina sp. NBRC 110054 TaxID=1570343 RepID=UPI0009FE3F5A|nr:ATP-binding cassette domain-containing protein [Demequina sp. NBRC 110054]
MANVLTVNDAVVDYASPGRDPFRAVDGVSLEVGAGEIVGLVGESGCGKSSLGKAIVGLNRLTSGDISIGDHRMSPLGRRARNAADREVQMVFQDPYASLNPRRRIGSQIRDALRDVPRREAAQRVAEALESVGLDPAFARRYPHQFSGGQRQRIAIARALVGRPRVIVADEPVSALDASTRLQVASLLSDQARKDGSGLLMISHDLSGLRPLADRVAVMYFGRIVEMGPTEQVWTHSRHPYTKALIGAIPQLGRDASLPTEPPRRVVPKHAEPEAARLVPLGDGHFVAKEAM